MQTDTKRKLEKLCLYRTKQTFKKKGKKGCDKRQRWALDNDKEVSLTRRYNIWTFYASNIGKPKYIKGVSTDLKGDITIQ